MDRSRRAIRYVSAVAGGTARVQVPMICLLHRLDDPTTMEPSRSARNGSGMSAGYCFKTYSKLETNLFEIFASDA
jgi:hypothetical protein